MSATTTSTEEGTVAEHSPGLSHLYPTKSAVETLNSPTPTHVGPSSNIGDPWKRMQEHKKAREKVKGNTEGTPDEGGATMMRTREWNLISLKTSTQTPLPSHSSLTTSLVDPKNLVLVSTPTVDSASMEGCYSLRKPHQCTSEKVKSVG